MVGKTPTMFGQDIPARHEDPWPTHLQPVAWQLTLEEAKEASVIGFKRCFNSFAKGRTLEAGRYDWGFDRHIRGAQAERAVASYLGLDWTPGVVELDNGDGDGMPGIQVKSVWGKMPRGRHLEIRPHNPSDHRYVLVVLEDFARMTIVGWIDGVEAKKAPFGYFGGRVDDRNRFHAVAKATLRDMRHLKELVK